MPSPWAIRQTLLLMCLTPQGDLPSVPLSSACDLPAGPGIYIVCAGEQALYIGATKNLAKRLMNHAKLHTFYAHGGTHISWLLCSDATPALLASHEQQYIKAYNPILNDTKTQRRYPSTIKIDAYAPLHDMPRKPIVRRKDPSAPPEKVAPNRIAELRAQHGISSHALAATLCIDRTTLWKWENSHEYPSWKALENLSRFFQVPPIHIIPMLAERAIANPITTPKEA